jgi:magnesium and cobalt transporter
MALADGGILVSGEAELRVVEEFFDMDLPGKPTDTVSLWILNHTARIPTKEEQFAIDGLNILVQDADERRIREVILNRIAPTSEDEGATTSRVEEPG